GEGTPRPVSALQSRCEPDDQQSCAGIAKGRDGRIEPFWLLPARLRAKLGKPRAERTIAIRLGGGQGGTGLPDSWTIRRNRRPRPVVPSWSRAAGIAARDDARAARAGPAVRTYRARAWIAARRGR